MDYDNLSDEDLQKKLDEAILKANPEDLDDEDLERRLHLRQKESAERPQDLLTGGVTGAVGAIGSVLDYPMAIGRSVINEMTEPIDKPMTERAKKIGESVVSPSNAPTYQDLAEKVGIPSAPIPGTEIPQSAAAGFAMDILSPAPEIALANKMISGGSKLARTALGSEEKAIEAIGLNAKDARKMIKSDLMAGNDPEKSIEKLSKYAQEEVLSPGGTAKKALIKANNRLNSVGEEIGLLRNRNEDRMTKWLTDKAGSPEVTDYLSGVFNGPNVYQRIADNVGESVLSQREAQQVMSIVEDELKSIQAKFPDAPPIDYLSKLKAKWQNEINYSKDAADRSIKESAYNLLQKEADKAIDNEINYADRFLSRNDLSRHRALKEEYGTLKKVIPGLERRLAQKEVGKGPKLDLLKPSTYLSGDRALQTIATIPKNPQPLGLKSGIFGAISNLANYQEGQYKEPKIEGFPASQTLELDNPMDIYKAGSEIENLPIPPTEKAKRLNLLNKRKRIYLER